MRSSYKEEDVILLLKDITGMVEPQPTEERERLIESKEESDSPGSIIVRCFPLNMSPARLICRYIRRH